MDIEKFQIDDDGMYAEFDEDIEWLLDLKSPQLLIIIADRVKNRLVERTERIYDLQEKLAAMADDTSGTSEDGAAARAELDTHCLSLGDLHTIWALVRPHTEDFWSDGKE